MYAYVLYPRRPKLGLLECKVKQELDFSNDIESITLQLLLDSALLVVQGNRTLLSYLNARNLRFGLVACSCHELSDAQTPTYPAKRALSGIKRTQASPGEV